MKKILLGALIVFILIAAFFDTKDYVLGNKLKDINKAMVTEVNPDYETARYEMEMAMDNTLKSIKASYNKKYKLPNNNYYIVYLDTTSIPIILIVIITGIGGLFLFIINFIKGNEGDNKYGKDPKLV